VVSLAGAFKSTGGNPDHLARQRAMIDNAADGVPISRVEKFTEAHASAMRREYRKRGLLASGRSLVIESHAVQ